MACGGTIDNIIHSRLNVRTLRVICKIECIEGYNTINKAALIT
jgi:hypothetical protein